MAPHTWLSDCSECNGIPTTGDNDPSAHSHPYTPPRTVMEEDWFTYLRPSFTVRESYYAGATARDLNALLHDKHNDPIYKSCKKCSVRNTTNLKNTWLGYAYAPSRLTFAFDRSMEKKYRVTLPLEHDFGTFVCATGEKTLYRLVTVIKTLRSGDHAAFVHAEDGKWFRCINESVRECAIADWQGEYKDGQTVLALYEKLE